MELWNYGKGESAQSSWLIAQSHSLPSIPFRLLPLVFRQRSVSEAGQQVYKTTRLLVGAVVGGIRRNYGIMELRNHGLTELWNYGTTERASRLIAHGS